MQTAKLCDKDSVLATKAIGSLSRWTWKVSLKITWQMDRQLRESMCTHSWFKQPNRMTKKKGMNRTCSVLTIEFSTKYNRKWEVQYYQNQMTNTNAGTYDKRRWQHKIKAYYTKVAISYKLKHTGAAKVFIFLLLLLLKELLMPGWYMCLLIYKCGRLIILLLIFGYCAVAE